MKMVLGSGTSSGHIRMKAQSKREAAYHFLDSYTNDREDGQCTEMKGVSAVSEVKHKAASLQLSAPPRCHIPLGSLSPMGV